MQLKSIIIVLVFLVLGTNLVSQDMGQIENSNSRLFELTVKNDTISFIKLDEAISANKPVLIILQGSLPIPLGIKYPEGISFTSFPFLITDDIKDQYHIVSISMPHIPALVQNDELAQNGTYINVSADYNKSNYLQNYIDRANAVITYLSNQSWVTPNEFVLFGHSQGSYVAIKLGKENPQIAKIGISACSPFGRYQQYLSQVRFDEHKGVISSGEAQNKIEEYYARWNHISSNRNDDSQTRGDTFKATFSFSENFVDDIMDLRIPIYVTYGTKDLGSLGCDYLPIEFERIGKTDYTLKAYPGLGHNFEEINENGQSNYDKMHWDMAFQDFIDWTLD